MAIQAQATSAARSGSMPATGEPRWHVRLLGAMQAFDGVQRIERFPSRAGAMLLARLALAPQRAHAREELVELLWPGVALDVGRNRLRQVLSTLKSLLEPADQPGSPVLQADRLHVRVVPGAMGCDARDFEQLARSGRVDEALARYGGDLMPGYYDEWLLDERTRLAALHEQLLARSDGGAGATQPAWLLPARPPHSSAGRPPPQPLADEPAVLRLPGYLTRLFGAELPAARLRALLLGSRLVSLLGPGGSGKTRLAVEVATALRDGPGWQPTVDTAAAADGAAQQFDGVAFVSLVTCQSAEQMADAMAEALRLPVASVTAAAALPQGGPAARLLGALSGRRMLVVLDNLEQLLHAAPSLVAELLALLPGLHLLVTSRHPLGVDGERCVQVEPLALPDTGCSLEEAAANPAVGLFVDRARAVRSDFHLGQRNQADIVALVRALQGMPLAIELAAARIRSFSPHEMAQRLRPAERTDAAHSAGTPALDLLARGGPRSGLDARHASMLRTVAWSWNLLSPAERDLLCALTIFRGGCTAEAVRALAAPAGAGDGRDQGDHRDWQAAADALHLQLDALVAHSMVAVPLSGADAAGSTGGQGRAEPSDALANDSDAQRFFIYEPIREFAAAQLSAEQALRWRASHRAWMLQWAGALPATPSLAAVRTEMPNIEAALASAVADGDAPGGVQLLLRLRRVLEDAGMPAAALPRAEAAVEHCRDPLLQSRGQSLLGPLLLLAGRRADAMAMAEAGLASLERLSDDPALHARALHALARVRWRSEGQAERALPLIDAAEPLALAAGDLDVQASLLALRAFICNRAQHDHTRAHTLYEQALRLWQALGNQHAVHSGLYNLAVTEQAAGRNEDALLRLAQLSHSARQLQDWRRLSQGANVAGMAQSGLRRWPAAADTFREALRVAWRAMAPYEVAYPLWNLPRVLAHLQQPEAALQLASFVAGFWVRSFGPLSRADERDLLRVRRLAGRQLDSRGCDAAWSAGAQLSLPDAVALALGQRAAADC